MKIGRGIRARDTGRAASAAASARPLRERWWRGPARMRRQLSRPRCHAGLEPARQGHPGRRGGRRGGGVAWGPGGCTVVTWQFMAATLQFMVVTWRFMVVTRGKRRGPAMPARRQRAPHAQAAQPNTAGPAARFNAAAAPAHDAPAVRRRARTHGGPGPVRGEAHLKPARPPSCTPPCLCPPGSQTSPISRPLPPPPSTTTTHTGTTPCLAPPCQTSARALAARPA